MGIVIVSLNLTHWMHAWGSYYSYTERLAQLQCVTELDALHGVRSYIAVTGETAWVQLCTSVTELDTLSCMGTLGVY